MSGIVFSAPLTCRDSVSRATLPTSTSLMLARTMPPPSAAMTTRWVASSRNTADLRCLEARKSRALPAPGTCATISSTSLMTMPTAGSSAVGWNVECPVSARVADRLVTSRHSAASASAMLLRMFLVGGDRPAQRQRRQGLPGQLITHVRAVELHHPGVGAAGDELAGVVEQVGFAAAGHADHPDRPAADLAEQRQVQRRAVFRAEPPDPSGHGCWRSRRTSPRTGTARRSGHGMVIG